MYKSEFFVCPKVHWAAHRVTQNQIPTKYEPFIKQKMLDIAISFKDTTPKMTISHLGTPQRNPFRILF